MKMRVLVNMSSVTLAVVLVLTSGADCRAEPPSELRAFLKERARLSDSEIASIDRGAAVAKLLPTSNPSEVFVMGIIHVKAEPEEYIRLALDINRLRKLPGYLDVQKIHRPPQLADFHGFTLEMEDIRDLKSCKPGKCGLQLPVEGMEDLQAGIDWKAPDVSRLVNERVQKMVFDALKSYQRSGNRVLAVYHDKEHPFDVQAQFQAWLKRSMVVSGYLPELNRYLLEYPHAAPSDAESLFFWEKVNFGLKSTLRLNHATTYRSVYPGGETYIVAVKQLYASHYFQVALDLTACVPKDPTNRAAGFYLVTLKGSVQEGLTGLKGTILRQVATGRTRSTQEKALIGIKQELENRAGY